MKPLASLKGPGAASKTQLARNSNIITNFSPKNKICFYLLKVTLAFTALLSPFRSPTTSIICSTCTCTMRTMCTAHAQCAQDVHIAHNSTSSHLQLGMALMAPTGALDTSVVAFYPILCPVGKLLFWKTFQGFDFAF